MHHHRAKCDDADPSNQGDQVGGDEVRIAHARTSENSGPVAARQNVEPFALQRVVPRRKSALS